MMPDPTVAANNADRALREQSLDGGGIHSTLRMVEIEAHSP